MTVSPARAWRVFPWDPDAAAGERFSPAYVPPGQGKGRFDLPGVPGGVLYLAETPEHAAAELVQQYRGQTLADPDLVVAGRRLALVAVALPDPLREEVLDLCDAAELLRLGVRPDETASRDRGATQRISAAVHAAGHAGLRWWSVFSGDWHTALLFRDRIREPLTFDAPEPLAVDHPALREAARALGIRIEEPARRSRREAPGVPANAPAPGEGGGTGA
ncbi:MAG TPA: RES family NAD+ phosphorylase [Longimicrobiaceae bacterium]|nr:RES family NAD+ phosphorylase [Longimicrobiaceae bacterium]